MIFTKVDCNLLARVERRLNTMAVEADTIAAAALNGERYRSLKAEADRVHRDIRDLHSLRERVGQSLAPADG